MTALRLAIVGHTNTGKTSLIRTLLRRADFGAVEDAPGTTRVVERTSLLVEDEAVIDLFDTPGLEDSSALRECLQAPGLPAGGPERLRWLLAHRAEYPAFEQECKVLQQVLDSDLLLYVVDTREPVLEKYRDEVAVLSLAARPILPVFNFIAGPDAHLATWREAMAAFNLHARVEFDTVAFRFEAEKRLYEKLQTLREDHYQALERLIAQRRHRWREALAAAAATIAEVLLDTAACRLPVAPGEDPAVARLKLQELVRRAEQRCGATLLSVFGFTAADLEMAQLEVTAGRFALDLFEAEALKAFGLDAGVTAAKGAALGAGIDLLFAGMSLGAASATGALAGAAWSTLRRYGKDLVATALGQDWCGLDDATLALLLLRQLQVLKGLAQRGHASQDRLQVSSARAGELPPDWAAWRRRLRARPDWSHLAGSVSAPDPERSRLLQQLAAWVLRQAAPVD